jgi:hypothetical protein
MKLKEQQAGLALNNQPQKTHPENPKIPFKMLFFYFFLFYFL